MQVSELCITLNVHFCTKNSLFGIQIVYNLRLFISFSSRYKTIYTVDICFTSVIPLSIYQVSQWWYLTYYKFSALAVCYSMNNNVMTQVGSFIISIIMWLSRKNCVMKRKFLFLSLLQNVSVVCRFPYSFSIIILYIKGTFWIVCFSI